MECIITEMPENTSEEGNGSIPGVGSGEQFVLFPSPEDIIKEYFSPKDHSSIDRGSVSDTDRNDSGTEEVVVEIHRHVFVNGLGVFSFYFHNDFDIEDYNEDITESKNVVLISPDGPVFLNNQIQSSAFKNNYDAGRVVTLNNIEFPTTLYDQRKIPTIKLSLPKFTIVYSEKDFDYEVQDPDFPCHFEGRDEDGQKVDALLIPVELLSQMKVEVTE